MPAVISPASTPWPPCRTPPAVSAGRAGSARRTSTPGDLVIAVSDAQNNGRGLILLRTEGRLPALMWDRNLMQLDAFPALPKDVRLLAQHFDRACDRHAAHADRIERSRNLRSGQVEPPAPPVDPAQGLAGRRARARAQAAPGHPGRALRRRPRHGHPRPAAVRPAGHRQDAHRTRLRRMHGLHLLSAVAPRPEIRLRRPERRERQGTLAQGRGRALRGDLRRRMRNRVRPARRRQHRQLRRGES